MNTSELFRPHATLCAIALTTALSVAHAQAAFPTGEFTAAEFAVKFESPGFEKPGIVRFTQGNQVLVEGEFSTHADEIRITDKSGPMACAKSEQSGTYRWKYAGGTLTFSKLDDRCDGRAKDLTAQSWKRSK